MPYRPDNGNGRRRVGLDASEQTRLMRAMRPMEVIVIPHKGLVCRNSESPRKRQCSIKNIACLLSKVMVGRKLSITHLTRDFVGVVCYPDPDDLEVLLSHVSEIGLGQEEDVLTDDYRNLVRGRSTKSFTS